MRGRLCALLSGLSLSMAAAASAETRDAFHSDPEVRLLDALSQFNSGDYEDALSDLSLLIEDQPDFRLANIVYADLLLAKAGRPLPQSDGPFSDKRSELLEEARVRWSHRLQSPAQDAIPSAVLTLADRYEYVIVVDLVRNRLYLMRNDGGQPEIVADFYASIGVQGIGKQLEGDAKTPIGVYHVTEYKPDEELPELYGNGAFPVNYPNSLDRVFGRTGYGIWVHGVPRSTYNRAPRASQGCVVVSNDDLETLRDYIRPGITPVVFSNDLEWLDPAEAAERRNRLVKVIAQWRQDRESADPSRLARHYAEDFVSSNGQERREYLADIADSPAAGNMKVRLEDISIFGYPGYREMALISFTQRVYSTTSKFQDSESRRQQFWRKDDSGWQVIHEAESPDR